VAARPPAAPAAPAVAAAPTAPPAARAVAYRDLEHLIGAHVQIATTNGTTRRGTLVAYASLMSSLRLDREEGGFMLALPAESVSGVTLLASAGPPSQANPDAQAH
jgi:hypothetical protein